MPAARVSTRVSSALPPAVEVVPPAARRLCAAHASPGFGGCPRRVPRRAPQRRAAGVIEFESCRVFTHLEGPVCVPVVSPGRGRGLGLRRAAGLAAVTLTSMPPLPRPGQPRGETPRARLERAGHPVRSRGAGHAPVARAYTRTSGRGVRARATAGVNRRVDPSSSAPADAQPGEDALICNRQGISPNLRGLTRVNGDDLACRNFLRPASKST